MPKSHIKLHWILYKVTIVNFLVNKMACFRAFRKNMDMNIKNKYTINYWFCWLLDFYRITLSPSQEEPLLLRLNICRYYDVIAAYFEQLLSFKCLNAHHVNAHTNYIYMSM